MGQGVRKYSLSGTGRLLAVLGTISVLIFVVIIATVVLNKKDPLYGNCKAYKQAGIHDIPKSSPYYAVTLDRDEDGIACETYIP